MKELMTQEDKHSPGKPSISQVNLV